MEANRNFKTVILHSAGDNRDILIRLIVGLIFISEGIQKYLFPDLLGPGRFEKIGFPHPDFWAYLTAKFEIICGFFILLGFLVRIVSIPLLIIMITAFITTKWPIWVDKGFWAMAHEYRTDFALTLLLIYLLIYGAGRWSIDLKIIKFPDS